MKVESRGENDKTMKYSEEDNFEELTKAPKELELTENEEMKEEDSEHPKLSKRKLKKLGRLSVAELKQLVTRPGMHNLSLKIIPFEVHNCSKTLLQLL